MNLDEILRRARERVDSEHIKEDRRGHDNLPGPIPGNFAQGSAHFSGRSPETAIPAANAQT